MAKARIVLLFLLLKRNQLICRVASNSPDTMYEKTGSNNNNSINMPDVELSPKTPPSSVDGDQLATEESRAVTSRHGDAADCEGNGDNEAIAMPSIAGCVTPNVETSVASTAFCSRRASFSIDSILHRTQKNKERLENPTDGMRQLNGKHRAAVLSAT